MNPLQLQLVLDPSDRAQMNLAQRIEQAMDPHEQLQRISLQQWKPSPCRSPGSAGQAPIVLLICPAAWYQHWGAGFGFPEGMLMVVEWINGGAYDISAAASWQAVWQQDTAARFAVLTSDAGSADNGSLHCKVQMAIPLLRRWPNQQQRFLQATGDYLIWWLRLCESKQTLHTIAPFGPVRHPSARRLRRRQVWMTNGRWFTQRATSRLLRPHQGTHNHWHVGVARLNPSNQELDRFFHLPPRGSDWFADPFLIQHGAHTWLFCERWNSAKAKGVIDLFELSHAGLQAIGTVLEEPFHLSFPRIICSQGHWYATVESSANGDVRLYRAVVFPTIWRFERQLLHDQASIDPILIQSADGWWLIANSQSSQALPRETAPELHLFHSPDLLHEPFTAHATSPLLVDSACGRNGGLLTITGQLHRVSQCTGIDNAYGEAIQLHRIDQLDRQHYAETHVNPRWLRRLPEQLKATHLHTLNNSNNWLTFDYR